MQSLEEAAPAAPAAVWPAWAAWAALVVGFAGALLAALVLGLVAAPFGASLDAPPPSVNILATVAQDASLVIVALVFARLSGRPRPTDFGLRPVGLWPAAGWAALTWGSFFAFTAAWVSLVGAPSSDTALPKSLGADRSTIALLAVAVLVCVIAPLAEEFFFRGFFFGALQSWRGVWPAALVTGLVFGAIHIGSSDPAYLLPLAYFGFALCALRVMTQSLYPSIGVHALNNSVAFGASQGWQWEIVPATIIAFALIALVLLTVPRLWRPAVAPA